MKEDLKETISEALFKSFQLCEKISAFANTHQYFEFAYDAEKFQYASDICILCIKLGVRKSVKHNFMLREALNALNTCKDLTEKVFFTHIIKEELIPDLDVFSSAIRLLSIHLERTRKKKKRIRKTKSSTPKSKKVITDNTEIVEILRKKFGPQSSGLSI